jgi:ribosomal protein S18 acetylase RimI-like enzyme
LVEIRHLRDRDVVDYFALRRRAETECPEYVGVNAERELIAGRAGIGTVLGKYRAEGTVLFGAFDGRQLAGVVALSRRRTPKYRHKVLLWGMYVSPECRRGGVARALMRTVVAWTASLPGVIAVSLQVATTNTRAQHLYEQFGFQVFGTEPRALYARGVFHDVRYMELDLSD